MAEEKPWWHLEPGQGRAWVCNRCKIVSYHHAVYCPMCPNKMDFVKAPSDELEKTYTTKSRGGEYTPYEWMPPSLGYDQPWTRAGHKRPGE
jgi:hypothetical protein